MFKNLSIGINLDDFINDINKEKLILENLRFCKFSANKLFQVIFKHKNIDEKSIKEFVKRNTNMLFDIGVEITKEDKYVWFSIDDKKLSKINWRYKWTGTILEGLVEYRKLVEHLKEKKSE